MRINSLITAILIGFTACSQVHSTISEENETEEIPMVFSIADLTKENEDLDKMVAYYFEQLDDTAKIAQLIMPAVGKFGQTKAVIDQHIKDRIIGGVLMLNGSTYQFKSWIDDFNAMNDSIGNLPFLYSADAEPSLVNRKITGSKQVKKANEIQSKSEVVDVANTITEQLLQLGINFNFAPVVDMSSNKTVGYRGFGSDPQNIVPWSNAFIEVTQDLNVLACAKHFPGHGLVSGDTHKALQVIDGELKELGTYPPLIKNGVASVMVAHIAIKNNEEFHTNGLPSTCSEKIVTDLLRDSLGFKGLIVTDAMNMGGVVNVQNSNVLPIKAGCDILLMPVDAAKAHAELLAEYKKDAGMKEKIDAAAKRIIRAKICLGLL